VGRRRARRARGCRRDVDARLAVVEEDVDTLGGLAVSWPATCRSRARSSSIRAAGGWKSPTAMPAASTACGSTRPEEARSPNKEERSMRAVRDRPLLAAAAALGGASSATCGDSAKLTSREGFGPDPKLPAPVKTLFPTVNIAEATGWPAGADADARGRACRQRLRRGLDHPRWMLRAAQRRRAGRGKQQARPPRRRSRAASRAGSRRR
jgi:hypothetical protein